MSQENETIIFRRKLLFIFNKIIIITYTWSQKKSYYTFSFSQVYKASSLGEKNNVFTIAFQTKLILPIL